MKQERSKVKSDILLRVRLLYVLFILAGGIVLARLVWVQLFSAEVAYNADRLAGRIFTEEVIPAQRGSILSRDGEPLATSIFRYQAAFDFASPGLDSLKTFREQADSLAKLLAALTFSAALILIVLLGGELFTGCNLVMGVSLYEGSATPGTALRVWIMAYVGNLIGILALCLLLAGSGASSDLLSAYLSLCVPAKLAAPWYMLLLRGVLCNFLVCVGVFAGFRLQSECGKVIAITLAITTFVLAGLEHSIANMAYFVLYALLVPGGASFALLWNLLWVTLGNLLGGAVLLGLPLWYAADAPQQRAP